MDVLAPMGALEDYWEVMAPQLENPPAKSRWGNTIPYTVWGDEGTVYGRSWMFFTWTLAS